MGELDKVIKLLGDASTENQIAAAIVLGEIRAKGAEVVDGLARMVESQVPALQRNALTALGKVGAKRVIGKILPLLTAKDSDVRRLAAQTLASVGEDVVPVIRKRMETASPDERRALDAILADLGGKDAFGTLLASLAAGEGDSAKAAAIAVRQHVRSASDGERRACLAQTEAFLKAQGKTGANPRAIAAAIKILGYLEQEKAVPSLLAFATDAKQPADIRQEAIIALRFTLGREGALREKAIAAVIDAASDPDPLTAQSALLTLGAVAVSEEHTARLKKLADHPDFERARIVIEKLGQQRDAAAAKLLVPIIVSSEKRRAEIAARVIASNPDAAPSLARALLDARDPDRRWMIRSVLAPIASKIPAGLRKQILETGVERLAEHERGWEAYYDVAESSDPKSASLALRELVAKLKAKQPDRALAVMAVLCRNDHATDDDRWQRAWMELTQQSAAGRGAGRIAAEPMAQVRAVLQRGYDVLGAIKKTRGPDLDLVYDLGFRLAEVRDTTGAELLQYVVDKGGRTKVAKMAKNKLSLLARQGVEVDA